MNRKMLFALLRLVVALVPLVVFVLVVRMLLIAMVHPAMGPAWVLIVLGFLFTQKADNTVNKVFSRWVFKGTLKE